LFDCVVSFLRKAAEARALLIVLDDLHAADPTSLLMLIAISRQIRNARVVVIGTYREVEIKHRPELAALLTEAEREGMVLPLRGLGEGDVGEFIERAWGVSPSSSLVNQLLDATEGNPFFLHEVLRQMAAEGHLSNEATTTPRRLGLTRGVSEFIKRLVQPLPEDTRDILDLASVVGREFDISALEATSQTPRERLIEALDEAASLELIDEVRGVAGRHSFRHALIREALYDALAPAGRRRLHRDVAEVIRGFHNATERVAEIAYHYCQGRSPDDADLAIQYSREAARRAGQQLAYEEAAHHLSNAIDALTLKRSADETLHMELLCDLGEARVKTGDLAGARTTCLGAAEMARRLDRPETFARAVVAAGRGVSNSGVTDHALVLLLNEALARLGDQDSPRRAQVLARLGIELYWSERERAVELCQQAVEMARRVDDPRTTIVALWGRHLSLRNPDSLQQRLADGREVIAIAERAGERDFALEARYYQIADLIEAGDIAGADAGIREYLVAEAELRDRFKRGLLLQAMRALMEGRIKESEGLAQQAFVAGQQSGRPLTINSYLIQQASILWERGRLGETEAQTRAFIAKNPLIVFARCGLPMGLIQLGRLDDARAEIELLANDEFRQVPRDWNWLPSMFVLALACAELGEADHAETLYRLLAPYSRHNAVLGYVYVYGPIAFVLGKLAAVLRRFDEAEQHFIAALAANKKIRAVTWLAHAECGLASLLLARGEETHRDRARRLIDSARRTAEATELVWLKRGLDQLESGDEAAKEPVTRRLTGELTVIDDVTAAAISRARELSAVTSLDSTVTILFSDIEHSSLLYEKLGDLGAHEVVRMHNEIIRREVAAHRGHEVKTLGDGFMIAFSSARRAARCAVQVQRSFAAYCETHPDVPMRVRMGLHVGEAINESSDLFGKAVILAARIATLAEGGQILVSSTLHDLASNSGDLRFAPVGEKQLKGLVGTHQIFEVLWQG
jgi:class 3 adenylate cyclase